VTGAGVPLRAGAVSVHLVRRRADGPEVLLLHRTAPPRTWFNVAGRIEPGETAWQAALRETREETGLVPEAFSSADIVEQFYVAERNVINLLPVFLGFVAPDAEVAMNEEHDAHEWLAFEAAGERVSFAGHREVLRQIRAEFLDRPPNPWLRIELPDGRSAL